MQQAVIMLLMARTIHDIQSVIFIYLLLFTYRRNTPTTNNVINIPVELSAIAPIAHADSGRRNISGIS